jgi:hypothetical protein
LAIARGDGAGGEFNSLKYGVRENTD